MKNRANKQVEVWADWFGPKGPLKVGVLSLFVTRGREIFSFEYDSSWLKSPYKFQLDPKLKLFKGTQFASEGSLNFGIFLDSSPDRWGRTLLQRREALMARKEKRPVRTLMESDYLLGVYDGSRMGGLRFKHENGPFLDNQKEMAIPPWTFLRQLEQASLHLEEKEAEKKPRFAEWLKILVAPGSSLGGARPKAGVLDAKQNLWIAKFPSLHDSKDVGAWEAVVHILAKKCGLLVPETRVERFGKKHHTFLSKRFDRGTVQKRIHFASTMTLLERRDGDNAAGGASYLEIVDFIVANGADVASDLEELWRRIVFFIAVSNSDDHLRNHGFLLSKNGWCLSPAYDINPNETAAGLSLNISQTSNDLDFDLALEVAPLFRLKKEKTMEIVTRIKKGVKLWREVATQLGIGKMEQDQMAEAFRVG